MGDHQPIATAPLTSTSPESRETSGYNCTEILLRYLLKHGNSTVIIIILGHVRSGKSSLFESLTGLNGNAADGVDSVTKQYQLGAATIGGRAYFFVDTPGFDNEETPNADILREIGSLLQLIKDSTACCGILYVHPINMPFSREAQEGLNFLEAFSGPRNCPFITFVTTMWDALSPNEIKKHSVLVDELRDKKWASFLNRGANVYHHGRVYEDRHPTLHVLDIHRGSQRRQQFVTDMIERLYPAYKYLPAPLIIQELRENIPLERTTAGKYLDMNSHVEDGIEPGPDVTPPGFDWFGAGVSIISVITFLSQAVWEVVKVLLEGITILYNVLMRSLNHSARGSLPKVKSAFLRVITELLSGLKFIVAYGWPVLGFILGYGWSGLYFRNFSSEDEASSSGNYMQDDDITDFIIMENNYLHETDGESDFNTGYFGGYPAEYQAFVAAFEQAGSEQNTLGQEGEYWTMGW